ncbi:hypothetical protein NC651_039503 [Populus alba x Populus x berolinensis]|nr:hypothetical protein NC651_039503 [Populus alba x Populus x berolinensis]
MSVCNHYHASAMNLYHVCVLEIKDFNEEHVALTVTAAYFHNLLDTKSLHYISAKEHIHVHVKISAKLANSELISLASII